MASIAANRAVNFKKPIFHFDSRELDDSRWKSGVQSLNLSQNSESVES